MKLKTLLNTISVVSLLAFTAISCNQSAPFEVDNTSIENTDVLAKKVKLGLGKSKNDGTVIVDRLGNVVATKRVTMLWRYSDVNGDGLFTWNGAPEVGDVFRLVNRSIYTFTSDFTPDPAWNGQISTFFWGPKDPVTGVQRPSAFRGTFYDDFIPGLPIPGDFLVSVGQDGLPVPGLTLSASLFDASGDVNPVPVTSPSWGIRYILTFAPGTPRVIPAGTVMFMDSQLDMRTLATTTCENGWSEEDWITTGGIGGFIQPGPNTAAPDFDKYPKLEAPPLLHVPVGHLCAQ